MSLLTSLFPSLSSSTSIIFPISIHTHFIPALTPLFTSPSATLLAPFHLGISTWYATTDPLLSAAVFIVYMSLGCWVAGEITGNLSQVDRLWTFLPPLYSYHFLFHPLAHAGARTTGSAVASNLVKYAPLATYADYIVPEGSVRHGLTKLDDRMILVAALQTAWMIRLSTNSYRRGFFSNFTEEDYRWPVLREILPWWFQKIVNFTFIAFAQNILLAATALPQYALLTLPSSQSTPLHSTDYYISAVYLAILAVEMLADNQQQAYQNWKHGVKGDKSKLEKLTAEEKDLVDRGYCAEGMYKWSRHPNFACEVAHWWLLPLFPLVSVLLPQLLASSSSKFTATSLRDIEGLLFTYPFLGPLMMTALFYSSTPFTEYITAGKYPRYKAYQKRVGMLWPLDTVVKMIWLTVTGKKGEVEGQIWRKGKRE